LADPKERRKADWRKDKTRKGIKTWI